MTDAKPAPGQVADPRRRAWALRFSAWTVLGASAAAYLQLASRTVAARPRATTILDIEPWRERPVLVFGPAAHPDVMAQVSALDAARRDLLDRQMPVYLITEARVTRDGAETKLDATAVRRGFGVEKGPRVEVLLVGKDTGVKLREAGIVSPERLFALVDRMPMRRREIRSQRGAGVDGDQL